MQQRHFSNEDNATQLKGNQNVHIILQSVPAVSPYLTYNGVETHAQTIFAQAINLTIAFIKDSVVPI